MAIPPFSHFSIIKQNTRRSKSKKEKAPAKTGAFGIR
jgi:hypothetical protein